MKRLRLSQLVSKVRDRSPIEKRMVIDAILVVALSLYLISPLPSLIIAKTAPVISIVFVVVLPTLAVIYLYRRLKFYVQLFVKKKTGGEPEKHEAK